MWKPEHRFAAHRSGLRYPSDLTGAEWAIVERLIPQLVQAGAVAVVEADRKRVDVELAGIHVSAQPY